MSSLHKRMLLAMEGDQELLYSVAEVFLEHIPQQMEDLGQAIAEKNSQALAKSAHKLKGSVTVLRLHEVTLQIRELEKMGKAQVLVGCEEVFCKLEIEINRIKPMIQEILNENCR